MSAPMPMSPDRPSGDPVSLLEMLLKAFHEEVFAASFTISDLSLHKVRKMVATGVNELIKHTTQDYQVAQAEANIRRLARQMISEARAAERTELKETDFLSAERLLCPLWPFC